MFLLGIIVIIGMIDCLRVDCIVFKYCGDFERMLFLILKNFELEFLFCFSGIISKFFIVSFLFF